MQTTDAKIVWSGLWYAQIMLFIRLYIYTKIVMLSECTSVRYHQKKSTFLNKRDHFVPLPYICIQSLMVNSSSHIIIWSCPYLCHWYVHTWMKKAIVFNTHHTSDRFSSILTFFDVVISSCVLWNAPNTLNK